MTETQGGSYPGGVSKTLRDIFVFVLKGEEECDVRVAATRHPGSEVGVLAAVRQDGLGRPDVTAGIKEWSGRRESVPRHESTTARCPWFSVALRARVL